MTLTETTLANIKTWNVFYQMTANAQKLTKRFVTCIFFCHLFMIVLLNLVSSKI